MALIIKANLERSLKTGETNKLDNDNRREIRALDELQSFLSQVQHIQNSRVITSERNRIYIFQNTGGGKREQTQSVQ